MNRFFHEAIGTQKRGLEDGHWLSPGYEAPSLISETPHCQPRRLCHPGIRKWYGSEATCEIASGTAGGTVSGTAVPAVVL